MIASNLTAQFDPDAAPYGVKLDLFEGPLDLLLFLIQKNEIDIYDIPIADITRQFLEYVEIIQRLNLEVAGDFVVMAATLMRIKSRMLLPSDPEAEEEEGDPREELVRRLLEYQQFREVAAWMDDQQTEYRDVFYRGASMDLEDIRKQEVGEFRPVSLFELLRAFKQAMDAAPKADFHEVTRVDVTTDGDRAEHGPGKVGVGSAAGPDDDCGDEDDAGYAENYQLQTATQRQDRRRILIGLVANACSALLVTVTHEAPSASSRTPGRSSWPETVRIPGGVFRVRRKTCPLLAQGQGWLPAGFRHQAKQARSLRVSLSSASSARNHPLGSPPRIRRTGRRCNVVNRGVPSTSSTGGCGTRRRCPPGHRDSRRRTPALPRAKKLRAPGPGR